MTSTAILWQLIKLLASLILSGVAATQLTSLIKRCNWSKTTKQLIAYGVSVLMAIIVLSAYGKLDYAALQNGDVLIWIGGAASVIYKASTAIYERFFAGTEWDARLEAVGESA